MCYQTVICLSCLSETLVYGGQTVRWIKMKLGRIVLEMNQLHLPQRGTARNYRPIFVVAKRLDGLICHLVWRLASAQATFC